MSARRAGLLLVLLAAGCGTAANEWVRTDTSVAQRRADEAECRDLAARQALDESFSSRPLYPPWTGTGFNHGIIGGFPWSHDYRGHRSPSYFARGPRQRELDDYCMRERGYTLQPVTPAS